MLLQRNQYWYTSEMICFVHVFKPKWRLQNDFDKRVLFVPDSIKYLKAWMISNENANMKIGIGNRVNSLVGNPFPTFLLQNKLRSQAEQIRNQRYLIIFGWYTPTYYWPVDGKLTKI